MNTRYTKEVEKQYHEEFRNGDDPLDLIDVEQVHKKILQPCFANGNDSYSDNKMAFHELILRAGGCSEKNLLLDYACGDGFWATYLALTGLRKL